MALDRDGMMEVCCTMVILSYWWYVEEMGYERVKEIQAVEADVAADYAEAMDDDSAVELSCRLRLRMEVEARGRVRDRVRDRDGVRDRV